MKRGIILGLFLMLSLSANAQYLEYIRKENDKNSRVSTIGSPRVLTVLVEFDDVPFVTKKPKDYFYDLLNKKARKYFDENSFRLFSPEFDIVGPVRIGRMADYGKDNTDHGQRVSDAAPDLALAEALKSLDPKLDFSKYDSDGDKVIDLIIYIYAGYDQSAGGPDEAIWSHHQDIQENSPSGIRDIEFGGMRLGYYICASELRGNKEKDPIGIGPLVHEMGHALGLPDFYDTNGAADGLAGGLYQFSPMSRGGYNGDGETPPYFNAIERILLGWMKWDQLIPLEKVDGWMNLRPVQYNEAAFSYTKTEGEYFIYECRSGKGWDSTLPAGLLVYHLDQSKRELETGMPALIMWSDWRKANNINTLYKHPCFYIVPPMEPQDFNYAPSSNAATLVFPGSGEVRDFVAYDWDYENTGAQITCIDYVNEKEGVRFRVLFDEKPKVSGLVLEGDSSAPIQGAYVRLETEKGEVLFEDKTGMDGYFQLPLGMDLKEACSQPLYLFVDGGKEYRTVREEIRMDSDGLLCHYVKMYSITQAASDRFYKYNPALSSGYFSADEPLIGAVRFKASELASYSGNRISRVIIYPYKTPSDTKQGMLYITVDIGEKDGSRVLTFPVKNLKEYVTGNYRPVEVDLKDYDIRVPEGLDMYVGYGCDSPDSIFPLSGVYPGTEGNSYYTPFGFNTKGWTPLYQKKAEMYMDLMLDIVLEEVQDKDFAYLGYAYIKVPKRDYKAGDTLQAELVFPRGYSKINQVTWTLNGVSLDGPEFVMKKGKHTLEAHMVYEDGREEYVRRELFAE